MTDKELIAKLVEALKKALDWCDPDENTNTDSDEKFMREALALAANHKPPADVSEDKSIEELKMSYAIEQYGHSQEMWSLPYADERVFNYIFKNKPAQPKATTAEREKALEIMTRRKKNAEEGLDWKLTKNWTELEHQLAEALREDDIVIAALTEPPQYDPTTHVIVPREPTPTMENAAVDETRLGHNDFTWKNKTPQMVFHDAYKAMIAAAPNNTEVA